MTAMNAANLVSWAVALGGGVVLIGGVASLTSDAGSPFPAPYKLAWTAIALEVFTLLVALYALVVGPYRNWKLTVLAMLASVNGVLIPLTNDVLAARGGLPGSDGSDTRANTTAAGLIVVMIGNFLLMLLSGVTGNENEGGASRAGSTEGGKMMA